MLSLIRELRSLTRSERWFVFFAMMTGFCISAEYSITRPASNSIFLSVCSADALPVVWLVTIPLNLALVALYNWLIPKIGALRIFLAISLCVIGVNVFCGFLLPAVPELIFFHFCWKDLYILFMFQQLWSMIHSTIPSTRAKYLYGLIFGMGTIAMVLGSVIPVFFAVPLGSERLFFATLPLYLLLIFFYVRAYHYSQINRVQEAMRATVRESFAFVVRNRYLLGVLLLVICMQVFVALVEYQFNHFLQIEVPFQDQRTATFSGILCCVHVATVVLQIVGALFLFSTLSVRTNHLLVPVLLTLPIAGSFISPVFSMVALGFIMTKSIDWSLFGVMREMLFVPLSLDEKFRAKAVIDVFAYRSAKAVASLMLLALQFSVGTAIFPYTKTLAFVILAAWFILVALLLRKERPQLALENKI
jgi:ATP:ADP antiporter, AAA family